MLIMLVYTVVIMISLENMFPLFTDLKLRGRPHDNALELPVAEGPTSSAGLHLPVTLLIWFTSLWLSKFHVPPILNLPP
jgi:hypothetical protein